MKALPINISNSDPDINFDIFARHEFSSSAQPLPLAEPYAHLSLGKTRVHKRHGPILDSTERQTGHHCAISNQLSPRCRNEHDGTLSREHTLGSLQATVPVRHGRRARKPNCNPQRPACDIPLYLLDPPPKIQHPIVLPMHDTAARLHDRLLQLPARRSRLR
jgi:hypothetical protein